MNKNSLQVRNINMEPAHWATISAGSRTQFMLLIEPRQSRVLAMMGGGGGGTGRGGGGETVKKDKN